MKHTTLLTLAVLAGWAVTAGAQTPDPGEKPKVTRAGEQVQQQTESRSREEIKVQKQETPDAPPATRGTQRFVDADGDGICDNFQGPGRGAGQGRGAARGRRGRGPGDGTGNQGVGPRDGSGFGAGAGSGNCDGTGPKGRGNRGGRR
jgi:hypothetical protein